MDSMYMAALVIFGFTLFAVMAGTVAGNRGGVDAAKKANRTALDRSCTARMGWYWFIVVYFFGGLATFAIVGRLGGFASSNPYDGLSYAFLGSAGFIVGTVLVFVINPFVAKRFANAYGLELKNSPPPSVDIF
jgi:hypothetical protein